MTFENNINKIYIFIIIFCIFYILNLKNKIKHFEYNLIKNENTNEQDKLINICYNTRKLIYAKVRNVNESNLPFKKNKFTFF